MLPDLSLAVGPGDEEDDDEGDEDILGVVSHDTHGYFLGYHWDAGFRVRP